MDFIKFFIIFINMEWVTIGYLISTEFMCSINFTMVSDDDQNTIFIFEVAKKF